MPIANIETTNFFYFFIKLCHVYLQSLSVVNFTIFTLVCQYYYKTIVCQFSTVLRVFAFILFFIFYFLCDIIIL